MITNQCQTIRRNGQLAPFNPDKITAAMEKAFISTQGSAPSHLPQLTELVIQSLERQLNETSKVHIEQIQDAVELALYRNGYPDISKAYHDYRATRAKVRKQVVTIHTTDHAGNLALLDVETLAQRVNLAGEGLENIDVQALVDESLRILYDGIPADKITESLIMTARMHIEYEPDYTHLTARLLIQEIEAQAFAFLNVTNNQDYFARYIHAAVEHELLDETLLEFDLNKLASAIDSRRNDKFSYLGIQTLFDRYLIHCNEIRIELPQAFFMRVAMGLALNEIDRETKAIEFYNVLSKFDAMSSTPTLFNAGTKRPQLSSCFLSTIPDDLKDIYDGITANAMLQKWAGGIGNDWTPVRGLGAKIKGTNGKSQGVIPFMKVANDTLVAVNQGGRRLGSGCAYLETWHADMLEFLELRKNTGDDRRRTHDMNTANWIPDLFMQRVMENGQWTLFSPDETPDLHDLYGEAFKTAYERYERLADEGKMNLFKRMKAIDLWRKMLTMLFETGHAWITFKDPSNLRNPQQHVGVVHSSNLCTEIVLNTKANEEIAVCNLASINLAHHITNGKLDGVKLAATIKTVMRMLDNVIDINYYPVPATRNANLKHRPVGLGIMGFQDALYQLRIPYESDDAVKFADESMEYISYCAIQASMELAKERGEYSTFRGSLWSKGVFPLESLQKSANPYSKFNDKSILDWEALRRDVMQHGMRNSNTMAIAPTATISNICGVSQSIEPTYQNLFVKANLSGDFTIINDYLVADLKRLGLWDKEMVQDLKRFDGSVQHINRIPDDIKSLYKTAFELDMKWIIHCAARRQKWIDQAQSLNLYLAQPSGRKLDEMYKLAWTVGLKTTYYLRTLGATHVEKSTITDNRLNAVETPIAACAIDNPECESCQ